MQRRPVVPAVVALLLIVFLALPFFSLRLGSADQGNDPVGTTTRTAYDLLAQGFGPGFNGPLQLVGEVHTPAQSQALDQLVADIKTLPGVASVAPTVLIPAKDGSRPPWSRCIRRRRRKAPRPSTSSTTCEVRPSRRPRRGRG